jgi:hypothetical protein
LSSSLGNLGASRRAIEARIGINRASSSGARRQRADQHLGDGINAAQRVMSFARPGQDWFALFPANGWRFGTPCRIFVYQESESTTFARAQVYEAIATG